MRIAHISDFHLRGHLAGTSASPKRRSREMVERIPQAMQSIVDDEPDLIVVSGDLVDHPFEGMNRPDHLAQGAKDLQWCVTALSNQGVPTILLPGNHDHLALFRDMIDLPTDIDIGGVRVISFADAEGEDHVPERVDDEREHFLRVLGDDDPRPQIHLQHYLIYPRRDEGYPHTYRDGESMRAAIKQSGRVRMCLSGHYHPGHDPECVDKTWFAVAPAFCEAPHAWRIYDIDIARGSVSWFQRQQGVEGKTDES